MVNFYARRCEKNGVNFYTVPTKFQDAVKAKIEADGYVIQEDGTVTKGLN